MSRPMYINCDREGCHVLCILTVTGRVSCPMYINCDREGCHVLCILTVTGRGVTSYVY